MLWYPPSPPKKKTYPGRYQKKDYVFAFLLLLLAPFPRSIVQKNQWRFQQRTQAFFYTLRCCAYKHLYAGISFEVFALFKQGVSNRSPYFEFIFSSSVRSFGECIMHFMLFLIIIAVIASVHILSFFEKYVALTLLYSGYGKKEEETTKTVSA